MTTCLLVRHGQSQANVDGILAGHLDSVLTDDGTGQVRRVSKLLFEVRLAQVVTSPLSRCRDTATELCTTQPDSCRVAVEERLAEVRYGAWTGRSLKDLAGEDLWKSIQSTPSTVVFPADPDGRHEHESMTDMSERAWEAWQEWDEKVAAEHGESAVWALVSHGDVIKSLLARAMGLPLDAFQSLVVDPASVSIIERIEARTAVTGLNLRDDVFVRLGKRAAADAGAGVNGEAAPAVGVVGGGNG